MDKVSQEERSRIMSHVRSKDTKPEKQVRSLLHRLGFRFRLQRRDLPGTPDIVLPKYKTVLFVHGCFWHRHAGCKHATSPKSNMSYWQKKFERNQRRDFAVQQELAALGWKTVVVWECELKDAAKLTQELPSRIREEKISGGHFSSS